MAGGYQPYGQQFSYAEPRRPNAELRRFGIAYMTVRGVVVGGIILLFLFAASLVPMSQLDGIGAGLGLIVMIFLVWLGYAITGGVLALKGHMAGLYMGAVDIVGSTLLALLSLFTGNIGGAMCWIVPNVALILTGINAFKAQSAQGGGYPQAYPAYPPQQQYGQQYDPQQYGGGQQQYAPPPPPPQQAYVPPEGATSAVVPSPKVAMLWILALAASVDPERVNEALPRARNVAAKLLGPTAKARIQRQLSAPVAVVDLEADLWQQASILVQDGNEANRTNIIRGVEFVLRGANGIEPLGHQFLNTLKRQLGAG